LLLRLDRGLNVTFGNRQGSLEPGWYAYVGSAYGPGGIAARLRRHFRADKRLHWHVDSLTLAASALTALFQPGGRECAIGERLRQSGHFTHVLEGFGSSDCASCPSHLLVWREPA
jgi:Uri superfamily endonuclease